jgi:hypothetical protein
LHSWYRSSFCWINFIKGASLPIIDFLQNFIRYIGYKSFAAFKAVNVLDLLGNLPCGQPIGIHGNDLVVYSGNILLTLFDDCRLKGAFSIMWDLKGKFTVFAPDCLGL